ncbi:unnamed protein product, partial [Tilletia laevis]
TPGYPTRFSPSSGDTTSTNAPPDSAPMSAGGQGSQPAHPPSSNFGNVISAEKREAYEALTTNRKEWLKELEPTFDKASRAEATEMAYSILLAGEDDPKHALTLAIEQINERRALKHALGRELFVSSEPDLQFHPINRSNAGPAAGQLPAAGQQQAPQPPAQQQELPVAGEIQKEIEKAADLPAQPKDKGKGKRSASDSDSAGEKGALKSKKKKAKKARHSKKKERTQSSSDRSDSEADSDSDSSSSPSSSSPSSDSSSSTSESGKKNRRKSKKKKDSSTDSDSSSDSEAGKKKKRRRKQRKVQWQKGKVNRSRYGSLRVSDKIAAKVQKSKYVDMWWFTEEARAMNSGDRPVTKRWSMEGSTLTSTDNIKPGGFKHDHELDPQDFDLASDLWVDCQEAEGVEPKTVKAWRKLKKLIKEHEDWRTKTGNGNKALQMLHQFQRQSFATETRQEKAKKRAIKEKYSGSRRKAELRKLLKFDPAEWPTDEYARICKDLDNMRISRLENQTFRSGGNTNNNSSSSNPNNKSSSSGNKQTQNQSGSARPPQAQPSAKASGSSNPMRWHCARCGSKASHDPLRCKAEFLAIDSTTPTFCINDSNGRLVKRNGGERVCPNYNTKGCTFAACFGKHYCSLCGKSQCTAQRCSHAASPSTPGPSAQR